MPQISPLVLDQALATEVHVLDWNLQLASEVLRRCQAILDVGSGPVGLIQAHMPTLNEAVLQIEAAYDRTTAAAQAGSSPRAVELLGETANLNLQIQQLVSQHEDFATAAAGGNVPGMEALIGPYRATVAACQPLTRECAGVVETPVISGLRIEAQADLGEMPVAVLAARSAAEAPLVFAREPELLITRTRSSAEVEANTRRAFAAAAAALVVVATRAYRPQLVGMRLP